MDYILDRCNCLLPNNRANCKFWDCPEFITTGYKLEVGHLPMPLFMLTANLFTQFVSDPAQVAKMVNYMSALMSAACILFLFLEYYPSGS